MRFSGKKILVVSPDFPYPPNHGGRVDIWTRLKALNRLGFTIDLIATSKIDPREEDYRAVSENVRKIIFCKRVNRFTHALSLRPFQVKSRGMLEKVAIEESYDIVMLETQFVIGILRNPQLSAAVRVMRIQNHEPKYFRELAGAAGWGFRKLYFLTETLKFHFMEESLCREVHNFLFISKTEYDNFVKKRPRLNSMLLPPAVYIVKQGCHNGSSNKVLFLGSLFMVNNLEALRWYIEKVHPLLNDIDGYQFLAAGNSRGNNLQELRRLAAKYDNIRIIDTPDDLTPLYDECAIFVNPMLHGAGVKIKNIEAIQNGLPVVSTSVGNEGTGLKHEREILVADKAHAFADNVRQLLLDRNRRKRIVATAQESLAENYNHEKILGDFLAALLENTDK